MFSEAEITVRRPDATPLGFGSFGGSLELVNRGGETPIEFAHGGHRFAVIRIASGRGGGTGAATFTSSHGASQGVGLPIPFPTPPLVGAMPDPCCG